MSHDTDTTEPRRGRIYATPFESDAEYDARTARERQRREDEIERADHLRDLARDAKIDGGGR